MIEPNITQLKDLTNENLLDSFEDKISSGNIKDLDQTYPALIALAERYYNKSEDVNLSSSERKNALIKCCSQFVQVITDEKYYPEDSDDRCDNDGLFQKLAIKICKSKFYEEYGVGTTERCYQVMRSIILSDLIANAEKGNPEDQYKLGQSNYASAFYFHNHGGRIWKDEYFQDSYKAYLKAAKQGHVEAQFRVARFFNEGYGMEKNKGKYIKWIKKAAAQGHSDAKYALKSYLKTVNCSNELN